MMDMGRNEYGTQVSICAAGIGMQNFRARALVTAKYTQI